MKFVLTKFFISVFIFCVVLVSCSKDDSTMDNKDFVESGLKSSTLNDVMMTLVANRLDVSAFKEIHSSVSNTVSIGLDEIAYAKEVFSTQKVARFKDAKIAENLLGSFKRMDDDLRRQLNVASNKRSSGSIPVEEEPEPPIFIGDGDPVDYLYMTPQEILESDVQFYWPNHENWDQQTIPLLAIASDEDIITAYAQEVDVDGNIHLTPVLISEEAAENIPVLIIGNEELDYEEIIDDNTVIIPIGNNNPTPPVTNPNTTPPTNTGRDIYTLYLGKFKADNFHEPWSRGGPEWRFHFAGTQDFELKTAADTLRFKNLTSTMMYVMNMSRKEAKKKQWYDFGLSRPLLTTWVPELVFGHFLIREEDPGTSVQFKTTLGLKYKEQSFNVEANFTIKSRDDKVVNMSVHKDFLLSTGNGYHNGNWTVYESGGVYYTLPIVKNRVYN